MNPSRYPKDTRRMQTICHLKVIGGHAQRYAGRCINRSEMVLKEDSRSFSTSHPSESSQRRIFETVRGVDRGREALRCRRCRASEIVQQPLLHLLQFRDDPLLSSGSRHRASRERRRWRVVRGGQSHNQEFSEELPSQHAVECQCGATPNASRLGLKLGTASSDI